MRKKWLLAAAGLVAGLTAAALDPMEKIDAYSIEVTPELHGTENFFPLGILGDRAFSQLPFLGLNITENIYTCYDFRAGKPSQLKKNSRDDKGTYFYCLWAAHSLYSSRDTANYGKLKNAMKSDGTAYGNHTISIFDPQTRKYVLDAAAFSAKSVLERDTDNITLWGIDNEYELPPDYSPEALAAFRKDLEQVYDGDLDRLNRAWGSSYRSFAEAVPPAVSECRERPGAWLDWRRFQDRAYAEFIADYFKAIRDADPKKRPVISKSTQCTIEMQACVRNRALDHEVLADLVRDSGQGWYGIDQYGHGDRSAYELNYLYNCILPDDPEDDEYRYGLFSAETNNHAGPGWQFAQTFWRLMANGFKGADFFVMGSFMASRDYATFSMTYPDGTRRDRFFYLSRLASMVHRAEAFMAQSRPVPGLPRVAMLMPKREVLLAADTGVSWWDYSNNNRLNVFRRLRDMGYWVDVIPYGKLNPESMKRYQALLLVDAEHLSAEECGQIADYVKRGGVLLADMQSGHYNEHHEVTEGLADVLGVKFRGVYTGIEVSPDDLWYNTRYGNVIRGDGRIVADLTTGKLENEQDVFRNFKGAWIVRNNFGKGVSLWFNTRLGALRPESVSDKVIAEWLADRLASAKVLPGYRFGDRSELLRVEYPLTDGKKNIGIMIAGVTNLPVPAGELSIDLPAGREYRTAFWAPAESTKLEPVEFEMRGNTGVFRMPEIATSGMLYLFEDHAPLLGQYVDGVSAHAEHDVHTVELIPGNTFRVKSQIANPSSEEISGGTLKLNVLSDWNVEPASYEVGNIAPGEIREYEFLVTIPEKSGFYQPNRAYPLVSVYERGGKRIAINNMVVTIGLDLTKYELLLSDNEGADNSFREFTLLTGAEYRYLNGDSTVKDPRNRKEPGRSGNGLTNRRNDWDWGVEFLTKKSVVEFDLKRDYELTTVTLVNRGKPLPSAVALSVGDGKTFRTLERFSDPRWNERRELVLKLDDIRARFVRIELEFPSDRGGMLDEIEISGHPFK